MAKVGCELSEISFIGALTPFMKAPLSWPNTSWGPVSQYHNKGDWFQHTIWGRGVGGQPTQVFSLSYTCWQCLFPGLQPCPIEDIPSSSLEHSWWLHTSSLTHVNTSIPRVLPKSFRGLCYWQSIVMKLRKWRLFLEDKQTAQDCSPIDLYFSKQSAGHTHSSSQELPSVGAFM